MTEPAPYRADPPVTEHRRSADQLVLLAPTGGRQAVPQTCRSADISPVQDPRTLQNVIAGESNPVTRSNLGILADQAERNWPASGRHDHANGVKPAHPGESEAAISERTRPRRPGSDCRLHRDRRTNPIAKEGTMTAQAHRINIGVGQQSVFEALSTAGDGAAGSPLR